MNRLEAVKEPMIFGHWRWMPRERMVEPSPSFGTKLKPGILGYLSFFAGTRRRSSSKKFSWNTTPLSRARAGGFHQRQHNHALAVRRRYFFGVQSRGSETSAAEYTCHAESPAGRFSRSSRSLFRPAASLLRRKLARSMTDTGTPSITASMRLR